jgi:hypothetical protein
MFQLLFACFQVEAGQVNLMIGNSSADIDLSKTVPVVE